MGIAAVLGFALVLVRVGGVLAFLPIVGGRGVPASARVACVLGLALVLFPVVTPDLPAVTWEPVPLALLGCAELLFGLLVGLSASLIFHSLRISGELVGRQMGMAMAISADPSTGVRTTVVGNFLNAVAVLTFFAINGHHVMLRALRTSFSTFPMGTFISADLARRTVVSAASGSFVLAFQLAAPLLVVTFMMSLVMALMARLAPGMNVLIFGFALRLLVGLSGLLLLTPVIVRHMGKVVQVMDWFLGGVVLGA